MFIIFNFFYNNIFISTILFNFINLFIYHEILLLNFLLVYLLIVIILFFIPKTNLFLLKKISLFLTVYTFFIFIYIYYLINNFSLVYYFFYKLNNIFTENLSLEYSIGIDTISYLFLLLTSFLFPLCLMISWNTIYYQTRYYYLMFILLEFILIHVFIATNILLPHFHFECVLIPMFLLIGQWGARSRRIFAAYQFLIYTLFGSLFVLMGLIFLLYHFGSTELNYFLIYKLQPFREMFIWGLFFLDF